MTFSFHGRAMVEHVNLRKEGATEAKHLACDIKLATVCDSAVLIPFNPALRTLLFTDAGDPRVPNIKPIGLDGSIKHLRCEFTDWRIDLDDVEAKKFSFLPMPGHRVEMVFTVAVEPGAHQTGRLAEMLGEPAMVKIGVEADLLAGLADGDDGDDSMTVRMGSPESAAVAAGKLNDLLAKDGVSAQVVDSKGEVLLALPGKGDRKPAPSAKVKALAREIIAQGPEVVEAVKAVLKARKAVREKASKTGPRPRGGNTWDPEELAKRIPLRSTGQCLVLRALADGDCVELRLAKRDSQALLVETGFELRCRGETTGSMVMLRERGMILDAIHDVVAEIKGIFEWPDALARAMTPTWPLSKAFRNIGVRAI